MAYLEEDAQFFNLVKPTEKAERPPKQVDATGKMHIQKPDCR